MADVNLNPYGNPSDLAIDGVVRGYHLLSMPSTTGRQGYEAHVGVKGALPVLAMRAGGAPLPPLFGPRLPMPDGWPSSFDVHSTAYGLHVDVFADPVVLTALDGARNHLDRVFVRPQNETTGISVYAWDAEDTTKLRSVVRFVAALVRRLDALAAEDPRYPDAHEVLHARGLTGEPSESRLRELRVVVDDLLRFAGGTTERVGRTIESRVSVAHSGVDNSGSLVVRALDQGVATVDVVFQGALPPVDVQVLTLTAPEPRGLFGVLRRWGEIEVNDDALDRAFLVEGEGRATPVVLAAREELLALARHETRVSWGSHTLDARVGGVSASPHELRRVVAALFDLWRRAALYRLGERDGVVDE